jgi:hypothetical protein
MIYSQAFHQILCFLSDFFLALNIFLISPKKEIVGGGAGGGEEKFQHF